MPAEPAEASPARERILQAVIDGLSELDPAALTIQQVCARAQVRPPTLYYHFGSKEGLLAAGVDALVSRWILELDARVDRGGSLEQTLTQTVDAWHEMITAPTRPFSVFIWVAMWSEESRVPLLRARQHAMELIEGAMAAYLGPIPDLSDLAGLILDGLLGAVVDYQLDTDDEALRRRLSMLATLAQLRSVAAER